MLCFLNFISTTANHIEATSVFKVADGLIVYLFVFACINSLWSIQKAEKLRVFVSSFNIVI